MCEGQGLNAGGEKKKQKCRPVHFSRRGKRERVSLQT